MKNVILQSLIDSVPNNASLRFNCPKCRGNYTLGITKQNGKVQWNCFKAGCDLRPGRSTYLASISELKQSKNTTLTKFILPEQLIYGLSSDKSVKAITKGNCLEPYKKGLFDIAYDPQQDRVCFIVKEGNKIVGIVGRAVTSKTKPKVLNYPNSDISTPFICGITKTIVLVEDCLSAASVARIPELSGLALLGSSLKNEYINKVKQYDTVIVALDRDARKKALAIKKKLCYYHDTVKLWFLESDIKDMSDLELFESFNNASLY